MELKRKYKNHKNTFTAVLFRYTIEKDNFEMGKKNINYEFMPANVKIDATFSAKGKMKIKDKTGKKI